MYNNNSQVPSVRICVGIRICVGLPYSRITVLTLTGIFGDAFFFRVLLFENFFGSCETGGHDWAFTQKSMQFLALCQGGSGSILLWKSISSDQVAICMPKTHFAYQSLQSAAAFLPNVCQKNQWEIVLGGLADA